MKKLVFILGVWTNILSLLALGTLKLTGISGDLAQLIKDYAFDFVVINTAILTQLQGVPGVPQINVKLPDGTIKSAGMMLMGFLLFGFAGSSSAGDLPSKAIANPFSKPYSLTSCGAYFGINSIGSNSGVNGATVQPGTQIVQAGIGGQVGYGCPINAASGSFWFVEAMADVTNLNGSTSGFSLSGPAEFTERFGAGTPLNQMLSLIVPSSASVAVPNLPTLPNGVTAGPANPYAFVSLHEKDISLSNGLTQNREWLISWGVGLGVRYRLSNQIVADVFAEYTANTQSICVGSIGNAGCVKPGQGAMVGVAFDY